MPNPRIDRKYNLHSPACPVLQAESIILPTVDLFPAVTRRSDVETDQGLFGRSTEPIPLLLCSPPVHYLDA